MSTRMVRFLRFTRDESGATQPPTLTCPYGHRIAWEYAFHEAGFPRCQHRTKNTGALDCNARLFIKFFGQHDKAKLPTMLAVEITFPEIVHVTEQGWDADEILEYITHMPLKGNTEPDANAA